MPEPVYIIKGPEELVVDDIIPKGGDYLVVEEIIRVTPPEYYGEQGIEITPIGYRVKFTDGTFTIYPTGVAVRVGE